MNTTKSAKLIYQALKDAHINLMITPEEIIIRVIEAHLPSIKDFELSELEREVRCKIAAEE